MHRWLIWILGTIIFCIAITYWSVKYLTMNTPYKATNLIVEGWLPCSSLEKSMETINLSHYKKILIAGIAGKLDSAFITDCRNKQKKFHWYKKSNILYSNGALYLSDSALKRISKHNIKQIVVYAHGDSAFFRRAHFYASLGDSIIGEAFTAKQTKGFCFRGNFTPHQIRFFTIFYGNDMRYNGMDRNLRVDSIALDKIMLDTEACFCKILTYKLPPNSNNYPFRSNAEFTRAYLRTVGYRNNFTIIDTFFKGRNKTRAAAKQVNIYCIKNGTNQDTFNVVSYHFHARRSYITYQHEIPRSKIGVICLKVPPAPKQNKIQKGVENVLTITDEFFSIVTGAVFYN